MPKPATLTIDRFPTVCFAPPLTDAILAGYEESMSEATPEVKDAFQKLLACVKHWWGLPESKRTDGERFSVIHKGKDKVLHFPPLEDSHEKSLDSFIPWERELSSMSNETATGLFDSLPAGPEREAAFHLLWHVRELNCGREPFTHDKLPS